MADTNSKCVQIYNYGPQAISNTDLYLHPFYRLAKYCYV